MRTYLLRPLLLAAVMLAVSAISSAQVSISVNFGPPALPVYDQPPCPGENYLWSPGYWAWSPDLDDYYWVPGTWVQAPDPDLLWTPGYWAFDSGLYYWHPGYWATNVGYYGGINYGFGYTGDGYYGGYWRDRHFYYNQSVTNINVSSVHYVYRAAAPGPVAAGRVSFNGGPGGTTLRPTPQQEAIARAHHVAPTAMQVQNEHAASRNQQFRASVNAGRPPVAATAKPASFSGGGVVAAKSAGAPYKPPANRGAANRAPENRSAAPQPNAAPAPEARGRNSTPPAPPSTANKREVPPPAERAPQSDRQARPNNPPEQARPATPPRPQAPPPAATARQNAPPPERQQARPAEKAPPPERQAAPKAEPRPAEKPPATAKPEARPAEPKGGPPKNDEDRR